MLNYLDLTRDDIASLPRESTLLVSLVSPIEVHGGHLPVGTDLYVAEGIMRRTMEKLQDWTIVRLPDLLLGAQAIPAPGSIKIKGRMLRDAIISMGKGFAELGFQYWMIFDNHGGATHQIAESEAAIRLKKSGLNLMTPFIEIFQGMCKGDPEIALPLGKDGGADDAHGGTNETSLMLVLAPEKVRPGWEKLPRWKPSVKTPMGNLGRALKQPLLGMAMDWFAAKDNPHYVGCPGEASAEAGEAMIAYHVKKSLEQLQSAKEGKYVPEKPFTPVVRALTKLFE